MVLVEIIREPISIDKVVNEMISESIGKGGGALVVFTGFVKGLVGEHRVYELECIVDKLDVLKKRIEEIVYEELGSGVIDIRVYYRIGKLKPGQTLTYIFVSAVNRHIAFDKAKKIIDRIKKETPVSRIEKRDNGVYQIVGSMRRIN